MKFPEIFGSAVWVATWPAALGISVLDVFPTQKPTQEGKEEENTPNARTEGEWKPVFQDSCYVPRSQTLPHPNTRDLLLSSIQSRRLHGKAVVEKHLKHLLLSLKSV